MPVKDFTPFDPSRRYPGDELNRIMQELIRLTKLTGSPPVDVREEAGGYHIRLDDSGFLSQSNLPHILWPGGRLTINGVVDNESDGNSDASNASSLVYSAYVHRYVPLYTGSAWVLRSFGSDSASATVSKNLTSLTANKNYDVFLYWTGSVVAIELTAWSTNKARSVGLTRKGGHLISNSDNTRLYVGTIRTNADTSGGTNHTDDRPDRRFVWNMYHRRRKRLLYNTISLPGSWTPNTGAFATVNGYTSPGLEFVVGQTDAALWVRALLNCDPKVGNSVATAIDIDGSGVVPLNTGYPASGAGVKVTEAQMINPVVDLASTTGITTYLGYNYLDWMEAGSNAACVSYLFDPTWGLYSNFEGWLEC